MFGTSTLVVSESTTVFLGSPGQGRPYVARDFNPGRERTRTFRKETTPTFE
jgi:hypothetical protein